MLYSDLIENNMSGDQILNNETNTLDINKIMNISLQLK